MPSNLLKTLVLLTSLFVGCRQVAQPEDQDEADYYEYQAELERATNVYPRQSGTEAPPVPPARAASGDGVIELVDLGLTFRQVTFDGLVDDHSAVFFSETEVTNQMYAVYLADTNQMRDDSKLKQLSQERRFSSTASPAIHIGDESALWRDGAIPKEREDHPVSLVTLGQAMAFCEWLNARYQLAGSFRLPTEAEWLMAAFGADRNYPWGDERKDWTGEATEPVKARPALATPDGLYGMWGNVSELVLSSSNGYGGTIEDIYTPFITAWQGASYKDEIVRGAPVQPRQDYWGYTHSVKSRSDEWGFRVVFVPSDP